MDGPILLTGAGGQVGRAILNNITTDYNWRLLLHSPPPQPPKHDYNVGDITDKEFMNKITTDVEAIIHLAGDPRPDAPWDSVLRNNINGTKTVLEAGVENNIEKFVFASSNHVVGHYETGHKPEIYRPDGPLTLTGEELPRPGNFYGVSKATGELLARYYHDEHEIQAICVRIGNLVEDHPPVDYERGQSMWLSHRDCAHLFDRCLQAEYEFEIVYGISDNDGKFYSLERAREVLGYNPKDNAAEYE
ncbi:MAG: NAD-dependent glucose-6-phosphate dehydrogenase Azf [Halobacteriaceae archaeon]